MIIDTGGAASSAAVRAGFVGNEGAGVNSSEFDDSGFFSAENSEEELDEDVDEEQEMENVWNDLTEEGPSFFASHACIADHRSYDGRSSGSNRGRGCGRRTGDGKRLE